MATSDELHYRAMVKETGAVMQCPVRLGFKKGGKLWTMPLEPTVSVKGGKSIAKRNIAKASGSGSVKEGFSTNDYVITVEGLLQSSVFDEFPVDAFSELQKYITPLNNIVFHSLLTDLLGIELVVVEDVEFPATPGLENQLFRFTAYSDQYFDLI